MNISYAGSQSVNVALHQNSKLDS